MSSGSRFDAELGAVRAAVAAARFEHALELADPAFRAARDAENWLLACETALLLGKANGNLQRPSEAQRWMREAVQDALLAGDPECECTAWMLLAAEHARYEQVDLALQAQDEVLRLSVHLKRPESLYQVLSASASTYYSIGLTPQALRTSRRALEVAEALDDLAQQATARTNLLLMAIAQWDVLQAGDEPVAQRLLAEMQSQLRTLQCEAAAVGTPRTLARLYHVSASVHRAAGDWTQALACVDQLLALEVELPSVLWCSAWVSKARMHRELGDAEASLAAAQRAARFETTPPGREPRTFDLKRQAELEEVLGHPERALEVHRQYHNRVQHVLLAAMESRLAEFSARLVEQDLNIQNTTLREQNAGLVAGMQHMSRLATTDALTGLLNRGGLEAEFAGLCQRGRPMVLVMLDIDHFKTVNDRHSHVLGDQVLRQIARLMTASLRSPDRLGRYGGEEFAAFMLDVDADAAHGAMERLRLQIEAFDWAALAPGLRVTVSAGLAPVFPGEPFEAAVTRADALLYRAKHEGRNRVVQEQPLPG